MSPSDPTPPRRKRRLTLADARPELIAEIHEEARTTRKRRSLTVDEAKAMFPVAREGDA